jgi:hypothetical protein
LFAFGIGVLCLGLYWHLYNDVLTLRLNQYILIDYYAFGVHYTHDKFYDFMQMIWTMMPWMLMLAGIVLLIAAGATASNKEASE